MSEFASEQEARHVVNLIVDVVGLKPNFTVQAGDVSNAAAVISNGKTLHLIQSDIYQADKKCSENRLGSHEHPGS